MLEQARHRRVRHLVVRGGPFRVAVADGHTFTRLGLAAFLDCQDELVLVGATGDEPGLMRMARERRLDVVVLDVNLPGGRDRFGACARLKDTPEPPRVLLHTAYNFTQEAARSFLAADAYLRKDASCEALARAVALLGRPGASLSVDRHTEDLTTREREVAAMMFSDRSNAEIAKVLELGMPTVKTHARRVLRKLGLRSRSEFFARLLLDLSDHSRHPRG